MYTVLTGRSSMNELSLQGSICFPTPFLIFFNHQISFCARHMQSTKDKKNRSITLRNSQFNGESEPWTSLKQNGKRGWIYTQISLGFQVTKTNLKQLNKDRKFRLI